MKPEKPTHLYHGSVTQNIKVLEPRHRYSPAGKIDYGAIYATPLKGYAATHSFPWSSADGVGLDVIEGVVSISVPAKLRERLLVPISIYKISSENFNFTEEEVSGQTWHSTTPTPVIEEIRYPDVETAFKELGVVFEYTPS